MATSRTPNPVSPDPWVFISYSTKDGRETAAEVRRRLEAEGIPLWQDRTGLEGGRDWWLQIVDALEKVSFLALVLTEGALASPIVRKEWRQARQRGVSVYPLVLAPGFDFKTMPRWMRDAHVYRLAEEFQWETFLGDLRRTPEPVRVPFMVEDLRSDFVKRPAEFDRLLSLLVNEKSGEPMATTAALCGAGGYGKTTLVCALCHEERIQEAFDDGILWVTLGENPSNLIGRVVELIEVLTGERPGYTTLEAAKARLAEVLADRDLLLVIDDVWNAADARPFLTGGARCARLLTTRNVETLPPATQRVQVDAMRESEAVALVSSSLEEVPADAASAGVPGTERAPTAMRRSFSPSELDIFRQLAKRLGEWPLLLRLVNKVVRDRWEFNRQPLGPALAWVNEALNEEGLTAFDASDAKERDQAVSKTLSVSLAQLSAEDNARYRELAIFPEDADAPLVTVERLWKATAGLSAFRAEKLCVRLASLSLLLDLDLRRRTLRLHDVVRLYLVSLADERLAQWHGALLDGHRPAGGWAELPEAEPYLWRHLWRHLTGAGRGAELVETVQDLAYLARKTWLVKSPSVEQDFAAAESGTQESAALELLRRCYVQASHVLNASATLKDAQAALYSRLAHVPEFEGAIARFAKAIASPWLAPTRPLPDLPDPGLVRTIEAHENPVTSAAFSPDGCWIVSGSKDGALKLWDAASGKLLHPFEGHRDSVTSAAFSPPDGRWILSSSEDKTLKLWDAATGKMLRSFGDEQYQIGAAAFSPDGRSIVSASNGILKLWDAASGELLRSFVGHRGWVYTAAFSPDSRWIVSGSGDKTMKLWDAASGQLLRSFEEHHHNVTCAGFSPDGRWIASGSWDYTVKLWDAANGRLAGSFPFFEDRLINSAAFSPDGRWIVFGSNDDTLRLWEAKSGQLARAFEGHQGAIHCASFSADGRRIVSGSDDNTLRLWEVASGQPERLPKGPQNEVTTATFSPDGLWIVSGHSDYTLNVWDAVSGQLARTLRGHESLITSAAFSPDGRRIVSGSWDNCVKIWDAETGQPVHSIDEHRNWINCVAFSPPDGRWIVSGSEDYTLRLWDAENWRLARSFARDKISAVCAAAFSPCGRRIVAGYEDKMLTLWETASGQPVWSFEGHEDKISSVAFSSDGRWIVSGSWNNTVKLWEAESGRLARSFEGRKGSFAWAAFSPDGRWIISCSEGNTLKLWEAESGACACTLEMNSSLRNCAFASDGQRIVASGPAGLYFLRVVW